MELALGLAISVCLAAGVILMHFGALSTLRSGLPRLGLARGWQMAVGVFALFLAHLLEIALYAVAYWVISRVTSQPSFAQGSVDSALDLLHFSATAFSTLGLSDLEAKGLCKLVAPLEGLVGFTMITWSATYTFSMVEFWRAEEAERAR